MTNPIHHLHIRSLDPGATANWYVDAFGFRIVSERLRPVGDRIIGCEAAGGMRVMISNARTGENLSCAGTHPHLGLEHFAVTTEDMAGDLERFQQLGAQVIDGPHTAPNGFTIAFISVPGDVRVEVLQEPSQPAAA